MGGVQRRWRRIRHCGLSGAHGVWEHIHGSSINHDGMLRYLVYDDGQRFAADARDGEFAEDHFDLYECHSDDREPNHIYRGDFERASAACIAKRQRDYDRDGVLERDYEFVGTASGGYYPQLWWGALGGADRRGAVEWMYGGGDGGERRRAV